MVSQKPDANPERSKDELRLLLQEALKKKRPPWLRLVLGGIGLAFGVLALVAWLLSPKGEQPQLIVVALDGLGMAGNPVMLQGRLQAVDDGSSSLDGKDVVFVDGQVLRTADQQAREVAAKTGPEGKTSCSWTFPPDALQGDFRLRLIGDKFHPGMEDRGRILLLPQAAPLCLVQLEGTLTHVLRDEAWQKESISEIAPMSGAAQALKEMRMHGYQVVYLALAARQPTIYQKMRLWVRYWGEEGSFSPGVVLSRFALEGGDRMAKPWQKTAELINSKFILPKEKKPARHVAIAGTIDAARQFHAAGLHTLYLGTGEELPEEIERAAGWEEGRRLLEKMKAD
jgi:hypothetical protein